MDYRTNPYQGKPYRYLTRRSDEMSPHSINNTPVAFMKHIEPKKSNNIISKIASINSNIPVMSSTLKHTILNDSAFSKAFIPKEKYHIVETEYDDSISVNNIILEPINKTPITSARYVVPSYKIPNVSMRVPSKSYIFQNNNYKNIFPTEFSNKINSSNTIHNDHTDSQSKIIHTNFVMDSINFDNINSLTGSTNFDQILIENSNENIIGPTGSTCLTEPPSPIISCTTGPTGPRGPRGQRGIRGPPGPSGQNTGGDFIEVKLNYGQTYPLPPSGTLANVLSLFLPSAGTWIINVNLGITNTGGYISIFGVYPRIVYYYYYNEYSTPQPPYGIYSYQYSQIVTVTHPDTINLDVQINYSDPQNVGIFDTTYAITRMSATKIA